jgi:hypothetical protein
MLPVLSLLLLLLLVFERALRVRGSGGELCGAVTLVVLLVTALTALQKGVSVLQATIAMPLLLSS